MSTQEKNSIIDKILTSKQTEAMEHLSPAETVAQLLKILPGKEADVIRRRFGLSGRKRETLEEIGRGYKVTRERIRQIERLTLGRLKRSREFDETVQPIKAAVTQVLTAHGGWLEESVMLKTLLQIAGDTPENCNATTFLLGELLIDYFDRIEPTATVRAGWKLHQATLEQLQQLIRAIIAFFARSGQPLAADDFFQRFRGSPEFQTLPVSLPDDAILAAVDLSTELDHNPYGEYGLERWGQIRPRRMNDKIRLVLLKHGRPMHFTEIAKAINAVGFDNRTAYPPTVHNELILDKAYVLVGRGIYALREWGYEPGVVADVLAAILSKAQRPMSRDELVAAVLKQRIVKRNTIHLALTNRLRFERLPTGQYRLVEQPTSHINAAPANRH